MVERGKGRVYVPDLNCYGFGEGCNAADAMQPGLPSCVGALTDIPFMRSKGLDPTREDIMASGLIRVTPEQLQSTSAQLNQGAGSISATLQQLSGQVNALGGEWAGTGQTRFLAAFAQWQSAQRNLHAALETIAQLTASAATSYASNDQQVGASFGNA